jgi:hypothetical protein
MLTLAAPTLLVLYHTSEKLRLQVHGIEGVDGLIVVGLNLSCGDECVSFYSNFSFSPARCAARGGELPRRNLNSYLLGSPRDPYQWKP